MQLVQQRKIVIKYYLLFIGTVFLDQISKLIIVKYYPNLLVINQGTAFGFNLGIFFIPLYLLCIFLIYLMFKKHVFELSLILGAALSNFIDRLIRGGVVDFIQIKYWPSFNLADIFIVCALFLIIYKEYSKE